MHEIEPFYNWEKYYNASKDPRSPFYGATYLNEYSNAIYSYYIHPLWDFIGSETLYVKLLFTDYERKFAVIELFGEWNDTLHNDIMFLKRQVVDPLVGEGINRFILIGENILNFHGNEDDYYQEWFEDVEDGWIAAINFRDFVQEEWKKYHLDYYINFGGNLDIVNWRTMNPRQLFKMVEETMTKRLG